MKEYISNSDKRRCVPCGYIYDPKIGDIDSWIQPWTLFENIPENWRCPVCLVTKDDFVQMKTKQEIFQSEIINITYLTKNVIELKIEILENIEYIPWQFISFVFEDSNWMFERQYSIASKEGNIFTFLIRIEESWRSSEILKNLKKWEKIWYINIWWNFNLQNTNNPKVFLASGTWLAPIYCMLSSLSEQNKKQLFFSVSKKSDLFYEDNLKKINDLDLNIHITQEKVEWYNSNRINIEKLNFENDSEFYICGSKIFVESMTLELKKKWFSKIYVERF